MAKKRSGKSKKGAAKKSARRAAPDPNKTVELHIPDRLYDIIYAPGHPLPNRFVQHMLESVFGDRELFGINHVTLVRKTRSSGSGKKRASDPKKVCDGS
jgi:hypothetical protein